MYISRGTLCPNNPAKFRYVKEKFCACSERSLIQIIFFLNYFVPVQHYIVSALLFLEHEQ